jgi:hypothetical protein
MVMLVKVIITVIALAEVRTENEWVGPNGVEDKNERRDLKRML